MALPADGRRELSDNIIVGNAISAQISPAFKEASIWMSLVAAQTCPPDSNVIKFRKSGSLIAEAVTEGAVYVASDANTLLADTSVTATAVKVASGGVFTHESERFGAGSSSVSRYGSEQGRALARKFDDDCLALIDSITNVATATSTLDTDTILTGKYHVNNSLVPPGPMTAVIDFKGAMELQKLIANSGAAIYSSQYNSPLFGTPAANNFIGNYLGVDFYQTTGLSTTGSDDQGVIFNPLYAFGAAMGGSVYTDVQFTGPGVVDQIPGMSTYIMSWMYYNVVVWNNTAACELRSDT